MARRRARTRARAEGQERAAARRSDRSGIAGGRAEATVVPRVLLGAVNGVEIVAVGALQLTRDVLLSAVSGAASIGAEAVTATVAGARGVVSAASQMVGDIAGTAQGTLRDAFDNARNGRPVAARLALRRPPAFMVSRSADTATGQPASPATRARNRVA